MAKEEKFFTVVGVRFKAAGKIYYFNPADWKLSVGDAVIVETAGGQEYGHVVLANRKVSNREVVQPLKDVVRKATEKDREKYKENKAKEKEAFRICAEKIVKHELPMKLVEVSYAFDASKIIFYFYSESRVDFRDLVKDLAAIFRTRIELRQIGVRDEAKMMGGLSTCGPHPMLPQRFGRFSARFHPHGQKTEFIFESV